MKTSNKILLAVFAAIVVLMIAAVVGLRFYVDGLISESGGVISEEVVTKSYDVRDFTGLVKPVQSATTAVSRSRAL